MEESGAKCLAVIPARYDSQRLPGKPLADIAGKSLIQRVYERAAGSSTISKTIVATDDSRIVAHCDRHDIPCCMTSQHHKSGSDRAAEVLETEEASGSSYEFIANVQGDMPFLNPLVLDTVIEQMQNVAYQPAIGTVAVPITDLHEFQRHSEVKVTFSVTGRALYFSRCPIPFSHESHENGTLGYKHIGLYVYTASSLKQFTALAPSALEQQEQLEQLRALENDMPLHVVALDRTLLTPAIEVDTPSDLAAARKAAIGFDQQQ